MLPDPIFWKVHMYGVMIAVGILACFAVLFYTSKKKGLQENFTDFVFYNAIVAIVIGFGSAAVFQAFYDFIENPSAGFHIEKDGGITFIGGLIGGVASFLLGYAIFRKRYTTKLIDLLPIAPCCILIAHAFGRVGCFFAGCCYGKTTDSIFGMKFPKIAEKVYPTMLYEAIFLFLLFGVLFYLLMRKNFRHNMSVYLMAYGIFRFFIEYLRGDHRGELVAGISPSQFWSILMVVFGVGLIFLMNYLCARRERVKSEETV